LAKKGQKYKCDECGLIVVIEDPCGCETVELMCCQTPMKTAKTTSKATKTKKEKKTAKSKKG